MYIGLAIAIGGIWDILYINKYGVIKKENIFVKELIKLMKEEIRGNVNLNAEEKQKLDKILVQLGISRIVLVQLLIKHYLKNYKDINLFDLNIDCDDNNG